MENQIQADLYEKNVTPLYTEIPEQVEFREVIYEKLEKEDTLPVEELEQLGILDINRYKKQELVIKIREFKEDHPLKEFQKLIGKIKKKELWVEKEDVEEEVIKIADEYQVAFHQYQKEKQDKKLQQKMKVQKKKKIKQEHVDYIERLMNV